MNPPNTAHLCREVSWVEAKHRWKLNGNKSENTNTNIIENVAPSSFFSSV